MTLPNSFWEFSLEENLEMANDFVNDHFDERHEYRKLHQLQKDLTTDELRSFSLILKDLVDSTKQFLYDPAEKPIIQSDHTYVSAPYPVPTKQYSMGKVQLEPSTSRQAGASIARPVRSSTSRQVKNTTFHYSKPSSYIDQPKIRPPKSFPTLEQEKQLLFYYEKVKFSKRIQYLEIATEMNVEKRLVKNWFARRRRKMKSESHTTCLMKVVELEESGEFEIS